jgi:ABC-type multidrug transport system, ATPase component
MSILRVDHLTKDFGFNKGVFDVSFEIEAGEVFGFLGPNGAGKTTTIRHILGFSKPQRGSTSVLGMNSWTQQEKIQRTLGYLPGEIAFPDEMTGIQLINQIAAMRGLKDMSRADALIKRFELDPSGGLKRMSKGMKQKVGIVCAFMHDPGVLVLDEPTNGLDPLMQSIFIDLIMEEKQAGKTILLSSHMFEEVEDTCDRIAIIKQGKLVTIVDPDDIRHADDKIFKIELSTVEDYERMLLERLDFILKEPEKSQVRVKVCDEDINKFIGMLTRYDVKYMSEDKHTLEEYFMKYYDGGKLND